MRADLYDKWQAEEPPSRTRAAAAAEARQPTQADMERAATEVGYERWFPILDHIFRTSPEISDEQHAAIIEGARAARLRKVRTRHLDPQWARLADQHIKANNWSIGSGSEAEEAFIAMIAEAALDAFKVDLERAEGNLGAVPTSEVVN